ncbi:MAG TPA: NACHT domain-containing protein, partial [Actinoplanes sp.]|nr:NACHT domain-containing protein [Actinoplanes sp.]
MTDGRRSAGGRLPVIVGVLATVAVGAATNIFTGALPDSWEWAHDWKLMGSIFALCVVAAVGASLVEHLQGGPDPAGSALIDAVTSRYARIYRTWVNDDRRNMDRKGLNIIAPFSSELSNVFVKLKLTSTPPGQARSGLVGAAASRGRELSIWSFLPHSRRTVLAVLGAPGSGKTTLLSHVARTIVDRHSEMRRPIPVWLQLRDHAAKIETDPDLSLPELIRRTVPKVVGAGPAGWWERRLRDGRCVVLLDGLDEVGEEEVRRKVVRWINVQLGAHPKCDFVVTSRPHGYRGPVVDATDTVEILPFDRGQVRDFLEKCYIEAERREAGPADGSGAADRGRRAAAHLLGQIDAIPGLHDLTQNPLLLTMIANVHRYGKKLPENRAMLYHEVCEVMLGLRDTQRGQVLTPPKDVRLQL